MKYAVAAAWGQGGGPDILRLRTPGPTPSEVGRPAGLHCILMQVRRQLQLTLGQEEYFPLPLCKPQPDNEVLCLVPAV